jgi:hypothetical protein
MQLAYMQGVRNEPPACWLAILLPDTLIDKDDKE